MLNDTTVGLLSALAHRPDAGWRANLLPFGSIVWDDEMPAIEQLFQCGETDLFQILRMFGIRLKIWDNEALTEEEERLWESIRAQVPRWALFQRLNLSDEDKIARQKAEEQVKQEFERAFDGV